MAALCTCQLICNTESSVHCLQVAELLQQDIASRLLMTYRKDFPPIGGAFAGWLVDADDHETCHAMLSGLRFLSSGLPMLPQEAQEISGKEVNCICSKEVGNNCLECLLHLQLNCTSGPSVQDSRVLVAWQDVCSKAGHGLLSQPAT